ncbi:MAG: DUF433 domain-containing protein [Cyanobacteria bacterium P01_A01_bin.15]
MSKLYGKLDPRGIPTYSIGDAAKYLRIPAATIRSWTVGRKYPKADGKGFFAPLIPIPDRQPKLLSFTNMVEVHVLRAIRRHHDIDLGKVRTALDFIEENMQVTHPLAHTEFRTDGVDLFIDRYGELINASASGQIQLKDSLNAHLERVEPDDSGLAIKLYPFTRTHEKNSPRIVVIDPRTAFGRLVIEGTGIPTSVLAERYRAGDSMDDLAEDYRCDRIKVEEAIRCELPNAA